MHSQRHSIFLVGPMGAGKSTVGKKLAEASHLEFVDSDHEIERRTGVDINFIFEKEGEAGFRRREQAVIDDLSRRPGLVLATGGGAVVLPENRSHLKSRGFVVYLHASLHQQQQRTERCESRPLLANGNRHETLANLFAIRDPLYREISDLVIDTENRNSRQLIREIEMAWMQWSARSITA